MATCNTSVNASARHGLIPPSFLGFTWYSQADLGVQFKYDFDFWGKHRAAIEAAVDEARAAEAERAAAVLMLTSAVADAYFSWQADQARLSLMEQLVDDARTQSQDRRSSRRSRNRSARCAVRGAYSARRRARAARSVCRIRENHAWPRSPLCSAFRRPNLPALTAKPLPTIEGGLPENASVDLLARRPDIAASRWRVEAALRRSDQARAEFYPDVSISALAGLSSIDMDKVFVGGSRVFNVGPAIHLPIFESGRIKARFGASQGRARCGRCAIRQRRRLRRAGRSDAGTDRAADPGAPPRTRDAGRGQRSAAADRDAPDRNAASATIAACSRQKPKCCSSTTRKPRCTRRRSRPKSR